MSKEKIPNKCDLCNLQIKFDQRGIENAKRVNEFIVKWAELYKRKIVPFRNKISVTVGGDDSTKICAINHPSYRINNKPCPNWLPDMELQIADSLSIHTAKETEKLTKNIHVLTKIILWLTIIAVILSLVSSEIIQNWVTWVWKHFCLILNSIM